MPESGEDVNIAERRDDLQYIDNFIDTASVDEVNHIRRLLVARARDLGITRTRPKPKKTDRLFSRLAVETVPILLTVLIVIPLAVYGVLWVMGYRYFLDFTRNCPPNCDLTALLIWAVVSGVGFLLVILAYQAMRKAMLRARD